MKIDMLKRTKDKKIVGGWLLTLSLKRFYFYHLDEAGLRVIQFGPFTLEIVHKEKGE